jgi:hypothetical protein
LGREGFTRKRKKNCAPTTTQGWALCRSVSLRDRLQSVLV